MLVWHSNPFDWLALPGLLASHSTHTRTRTRARTHTHTHTCMNTHRKVSLPLLFNLPKPLNDFNFWYTDVVEKNTKKTYIYISQCGHVILNHHLKDWGVDVHITTTAAILHHNDIDSVRTWYRDQHTNHQWIHAGKTWDVPFNKHVFYMCPSTHLSILYLLSLLLPARSFCAYIFFLSRQCRCTPQMLWCRIRCPIGTSLLACKV